MKSKKGSVMILTVIVIIILCSVVLDKFIYNKTEIFQGKIIEINDNKL